MVNDVLQLVRQAVALTGPRFGCVEADQPATGDPQCGAANRQVSVLTHSDARQLGDQLVGDWCLSQSGQLQKSVGLQLGDDSDLKGREAPAWCESPERREHVALLAFGKARGW
jgi:hypothetical protein